MVRQAQTRSSRSRTSPSRQSKRPRQAEPDVPTPDVYQEMLEEAEARDPGEFASDRPIKRRKAADMKAIPVTIGSTEQTHEHPEVNKYDTQAVQTVYDSSTSEESDVEWEDVEIPQAPQTLLPERAANQGGDEMLEITLEQGSEKRKRAVHRRKPLTASERKARLEVHKCHLVCLFGHVRFRNAWCNDEQLQEFLKKMLPRKVIALLHPDENKPHYTRSTTFMDGLNEAGDAFTRRFRVTKPGLKRAHWAEDETQLKKKLESIMSNAEVFLSKEDFRTQAQTMQGSRDFGAQLFCALLRSVAVEARLVCSLQPLPFSGTIKDMSQSPSKPKPEYIVISSDDQGSSTDDNRKTEKSPAASRVRRIGQPKFAPSRPPQPKSHQALYSTSRDSSFPVFWVEAFNEAAQKWVPIDPVVTKTLAKPSKFEPPAGDPQNLMNYVVGFEDDGSARDVTRRYVKAFNAKTRKLRVEITRNGEKWWQRVLRRYEKPFLADRDAAEISELTSKSAAEPMPRSIQDFKDHPIYALERHLRRNEVIHPKRVIGHVGLGKSTARNEVSEPVYRRSDVHIVRSSDKWYRLGRDVKVGEQPLKRVAASRNKVAGFSDDDDDNEPEETTLYAEFQTELYVPPPVIQGRVPKNAYGNLDVYVPTMVPPGGVHIKRPEAVRAARILGIDYADAVIGFEFRGRRGTAVLGGIVIASEYHEALEEVLRGLEDERQLAALEARTAEALRFWRLFLVKLRIAERVKQYAGDEEQQPQVEDIEEEMDVEDAGGGFFPEPNQQIRSPPRKMLGNERLPHNQHSRESSTGKEAVQASAEEQSDVGGGFLPDEPDEPGPASDLDQVQSPKVTPLSTNLPPIPASDGSKKPSFTPRYSLVVVPKHDPNPPSAPQDLVGSTENEPIAVDSSTNDGSKSASVITISRPPSPAREEQRSPAPKYDSDSEIEKGSLLSEDPEDEDAIPEWLMFDED
ncbi:uncharacterized protein N7515_005674 [Penicillium bovifimosum]|uniref:DNA repair protein Rad4 n=1 Tax=Penicillium bovifimosum TaxID=126998 RepID=A0A9W9L0C9_9EURO|nr:uncharacterized protein N7515_005674 [Penicillium bovifimosum]KAJ5129635.1 hypothetical protein N7515_005674 [Penicillium bovifimosum]